MAFAYCVAKLKLFASISATDAKPQNVSRNFQIMKAIILIFAICFLLNPTYSFSQNFEVSGFEDLDFITSISEAEKLAKVDVENDNLHLLLVSGINPSFQKNDFEVETKYHFKYLDFGDVSPKNEYIVAYNRIIIKSLCKKYGKKIFKKIRKDIIGYRTFKKENFC